MKSSSLHRINGSPVDRTYRDALIHDWVLKMEGSRLPLIYKLTKVRPSILFSRMQDGEIQIEGRLYSVIWISGPSRIKKEEWCLVSLRYCTKLERGYALIKLIEDRDGDQEKTDKLAF